MDKIKLMESLQSVINSMVNPEVLLFTTSLLNVAPKSFWERPSSRNHHPEDERGQYGDIIHTIRVAKTVTLLCDIPNITGTPRDILVSVAILHDTCRYGLNDEANYTVTEHALLVRQLAKEHRIECKFDEPIFNLIENHMGRWGQKIYTPKLSFNAILHIADTVCARIVEVLDKEKW